jgi:hypothetical protein
MIFFKLHIQLKAKTIFEGVYVQGEVERSVLFLVQNRLKE